MIGRLFAWFVFLCAVAVAARDGLVFLESGAYSPLTLGGIWGALGPASLQGTPGAAAPLAGGPASAVLAGAAAIIALLGRHRRRKWRSGSLS